MNLIIASPTRVIFHNAPKSHLKIFQSPGEHKLIHDWSGHYTIKLTVPDPMKKHTITICARLWDSRVSKHWRQNRVASKPRGNSTRLPINHPVPSPPKQNSPLAHFAASQSLAKSCKLRKLNLCTSWWCQWKYMMSDKGLWPVFSSFFSLFHIVNCLITKFSSALLCKSSHSCN